MLFLNGWISCVAPYMGNLLYNYTIDSTFRQQSSEFYHFKYLFADNKRHPSSECLSNNFTLFHNFLKIDNVRQDIMECRIRCLLVLDVSIP